VTFLFILYSLNSCTLHVHGEQNRYGETG
jgi:hypothetical protein